MASKLLLNMACMAALAAGLGASASLAHPTEDDDWPYQHSHWQDGMMMQPGHMMQPGYMTGQGHMMGQGYLTSPSYMMNRGYRMGPAFMMDPDEYHENVYRRQPLRDDLGVEDVRHMMEHRLQWMNNPNLRLGDVKEADGDTISVDIVTTDGSLVQRMHVNRHTGMMQPER